ncbi:MAG: IclR family transcriptional regulator [Ramlibacter sp.]|nr:IclR family transcriptional regulator [Ramlibacter sp.]
MADAAPGSTSRLSSVAASLRLLKAFTAQEPEIGISELARRLGLGKSTVHRLASTLSAEGFLEQNPQDGRYRLGLALFSLGTLVRRRMDIATEALPHLHTLREKSNETVHLAVLDGEDIVYLYNLESQQAIRIRSYLGVRKPAFCTSEGRAILAFSPADAVARALPPKLAARTAATLTDAAAVRRALDEVRRAGYAVDDEESEEGQRGIAAPVRDASGSVVAAVGMAGPIQRLTKKSLRGMVPLVMETADVLSARLGYRA